MACGSRFQASCGASGIGLSRFTLYNVATALVWALLFTGVGYAFGAAATAAIHGIRRYEWIILVAILAITVIMHGASGRLRRWIEGEDIETAIEPKPKAPGRP